MAALIRLAPEDRDHDRQVKAIEDALAGSPWRLHLSGGYGTGRRRRRSPLGYDYEESPGASLARETRLLWKPGREGTRWAREYWTTRKGSVSPSELIAWTVDASDRIVRVWRRRAHDDGWAVDGRRDCPIEAVWMPSVAPGLVSFPAAPFLRAADGDQEAAAAVERLGLIRRQGGVS